MKTFLTTMLLTLSIALPLSSQAGEHPPASLNVSGTGQVSATPDKAMISVSVEARSKRVQEARDEVNAVIARALGITDGLNIERKYVNTSNSQIRPEYRYHERKRIFEGYYVSRQVIIDLRNLELIGTLTEKLLDAGINNVSPPQLGSSKAVALQRQALKRATADAMANAKAVADTLGVKVGKPLSVNANSRHNPGPRPVMMMKADYAESSSGAAATYETGEINFSASVNASFAID